MLNRDNVVLFWFFKFSPYFYAHPYFQSKKSWKKVFYGKKSFFFPFRNSKRIRSFRVLNCKLLYISGSLVSNIRIDSFG